MVICLLLTLFWEKAVATHSSILAWKIPWMEEPGRLQSTRSLRVGQLRFHFSLSGNPLQCSCLENPRYRGAWWAAVYGVAQNQTWLKWFSSSSNPILGFPGGSAGKESACNVGDLGSIPGLGRFPGEGKGYPLLYSGLENSMDCIVPWGGKSRTWLSDFYFTSLYFDNTNFDLLLI